MLSVDFSGVALAYVTFLVAIASPGVVRGYLRFKKFIDSVTAVIFAGAGASLLFGVVLQ